MMAVLSKQKTIKQTNRKAILNILRNSKGMSVAAFSKKVNLSRTTLMKIMNYYVKRDLVYISGKGESTEEGGKKPNIFKFNPNGGYAVGMMILANRLLTTVTNLNGNIKEKISVDIMSNENFGVVLDKIIYSYEEILKRTNIDRRKLIGLAIGTYGITNSNEGIVLFSPHFPSWGENVPLKKKVMERIQDNIPVIVDNGIRFQVYAEKIAGVAKKEKNIVTILAGKGLGAGVMLENEIKRGQHFLIGEVGHMIINPDSDEECACGGKGCFEVMVSAGRLIKMAKVLYEEYPESLIFNGRGYNSINIYDIFQAAEKKDKLALTIMDDVIKWFSIGLSNIILLYDPEIVVIQGIFSKAGNYFIKSLRDRVSKISLPNIKKNTTISYSELGDNVGVLGAASYVISRFFTY
ncbi:MAG: ROK family protein [Candidatus Humimicrobiaceae bacterium]